MDIEFHNLTYTVRTRGIKGKYRDVLRSVNGRFASGQLAAIIGPSGAGKSSLLNAISGYRSNGVTGELLVNGRTRDPRSFHRASCYIQQEDLLQPLLSVGEAMSVTARLKLPAGVQAGAQSDQILKNLGLLEHKNTRTDLLSGGQKKRLSIALELVNNPPVFFLDEPTSGLDTVTMVQCVRLLRQLARQGRTVVATIHQPSASVLTLFDQVYVMAQGICIYNGDTAAIVPFLNSVGLPCPKHHNPADFIMEVTENSENIITLSNAVLNGKSYKTETLQSTCGSRIETLDRAEEANKLLEDHTCISLDNVTFQQRRGSYSSQSSQGSNITSTMAWLKINNSSKSECGYNTSAFRQFKVLLFRMLLQIMRNTTGLWIQSVHHVMCGLLIGLCFYGTSDDGAQMFNHLKFCIGVVIFFAYTQIMVPVLAYPQEVKLVKKEYFNRWYGLTPYYLALTVSKLPVQVSLNVLFCAIVYAMYGLPQEGARFARFCVVGNVVSLVAEGFGLAIGSVFSITNGCAIGPSSIAPFLGLAIYGFDFARSIPWFMNVLMKTSFLRCGVVAMVLTTFGYGRPALQCSQADVYCHFAEPEVLLRYLDITEGSVAVEVAIMLFIMLLFRTACYVGLRWRFAT